MTIRIPTLSASKGWLTSDADKAAYLITFFIYNPGGVSDYFETYNGSLRNLAYSSQYSSTDMAVAVKSKLTYIFSRNFPGRVIDINITLKDIYGYKYSLRFEITVSPDGSADNYQPIILSGIMKVDDDYRITLNYTK